MRRPERLVLATHNAGKVREIRDLLRPLGIEPTSAAELGLTEPDETEETFAGNARIKAHAASGATGLPALVGVGELAEFRAEHRSTVS